MPMNTKFDIRDIAKKATNNGVSSSGNALLDAIAGVGSFDIEKSMQFWNPNIFGKR